MTGLKDMVPAAEQLPGSCDYCGLYLGAGRTICDGCADEAERAEGRCTNENGHDWIYTGTAYGGDDPSYHGEGRCYCRFCGADGDA